MGKILRRCGFAVIIGCMAFSEGFYRGWDRHRKLEKALIRNDRDFNFVSRYEKYREGIGA